MDARKTHTGLEMKSLPEIRGELRLGEPMSLHTSFRIGGPAEVFAAPHDVSDLQVLLYWAQANSLPVFVLGAGTNLLVADRGIRGLVVCLGPAFERVRVRGCEVRAGGAARVSAVLRKSIRQGLSGLECLAGIPGTIGGAICMNAGTPDGCIKDSLESATVLDVQADLHELPACELGLRYRGSAVWDNRLIIVEAAFRLSSKESEGINDTVKSLLSERRRSQPVGVRTAGSVFKNPPGGYAGQMLEALGAKGMQIGGARVSSKHANFIENTGNASAADVRKLIVELQRLAADRFGVTLEPEIQMVGEW